MAYKQEFHSVDCFPRVRYIIEGTHFVECRECGNADGLNWVSRKRQQLEANQLCFNCQFWHEYVARAYTPDVARIDGVHYVIGEEDTTIRLRGFGGRKWRIVFNDGRIVETTNLWEQGKIPARLADRLPDNARFEEVK